MDEKTQSVPEYTNEWVRQLLFEFRAPANNDMRFFVHLQSWDVLNFYFKRTRRTEIGKRIGEIEVYLRTFYEENIEDVHYDIETALDEVSDIDSLETKLYTSDFARRQTFRRMIYFMKRYYNVSTLDQLSIKTGIADLSTRVPALLTTIMPIHVLIFAYAHYMNSNRAADVHVDAEFIRCSTAQVLLDPFKYRIRHI
jgi:hypothetical protein